MPGSPQVVLRIAYARYAELRDDVIQQMTRGGLLVKIDNAADLLRDTLVRLELVLPDGAALHGDARVLQVLAGFGVAVSVGAALVDQAQRATGVDPPGAGAARHERVDPGGHRAPERASEPALQRPRPAVAKPAGPPAASATPVAPEPSPPDEPEPDEPDEPGTPAKPDGPTRAEKIQKALHGTRDERNAILRDRDRTLHSFVLKNPQLNADDVVTIAKNAQMTPDLLKQIGERKDWLQRSAIALALARNPKTPPELAIRALDHIPLDALRMMAKGVGVLPHVTQAARKKVLR